MSKKKFSPERVVAKLRQIEVLQAGGKSIPVERALPVPLVAWPTQTSLLLAYCPAREIA